MKTYETASRTTQGIPDILLICRHDEKNKRGETMSGLHEVGWQKIKKNDKQLALKRGIVFSCTKICWKEEICIC